MSEIINKLINLKEDMILDIFNSKFGTFDDLKKLNLIFNLILKIVKILQRNIQSINLQLTQIIIPNLT